MIVKKGAITFVDCLSWVIFKSYKIGTIGSATNDRYQINFKCAHNLQLNNGINRIMILYN